ncbi:MAG: ACT domain-containing protein [Oscillospiraceae bacterium]
MEIKALEQEFSVCKVAELSQVKLDSRFCFTGCTDEESSLVCPTADVPDNTLCRDDGRRGFRIQGTPDFSLIGILAKISTVLADEGIGIFVVSTYNTDYIFTKSENFRRALDALAECGHTIV